MKEAISCICRNIDSGIYEWHEKKGWDKYGIKVVGNREIIDKETKEHQGGHCILM
jgi:hypothetical protein